MMVDDAAYSRPAPNLSAPLLPVSDPRAESFLRAINLRNVCLVPSRLQSCHRRALIGHSQRDEATMSARRRVLS
jgi:hypothetical protein